MKSYINPNSGESIYRQIVEAVKLQIARGDLKAGDQLPSLRSLANELGINVRTVVKAYDELVKGGLAQRKQGKGVFVTAPQEILPAKRRRSVLTELAERLLSEAKRLGADADEVMEIIEEVADSMEAKK